MCMNSTGCPSSAFKIIMIFLVPTYRVEAISCIIVIKFMKMVMYHLANTL